MGKAKYGAMPTRKGGSKVAPDAAEPNPKSNDAGAVADLNSAAKSIYGKAVSTAGGGTTCGGDDAVRSR